MKTPNSEGYLLDQTKRPRTPLASLLAGCLLAAAVPATHGANWAWDTSPGAADFNSANWTSGTIPAAGTGIPQSLDSLYFGASSQTSLNNDFSGYTLDGLSFNSGASGYTIGGNAITLDGSIANNSSTLQTINLNLALGAASAITTSPGGGDITLGGNISGAYPITSSGPGTLTLAGANTYTGTNTVNGGILNYSGSLNASAENFTVNARLNLSGTLSINQLWVGDPTGSSGAVYQSGGSLTLNQAAGTDNLRIGSGNNGYGYFNFSGGTLNVAQLNVSSRGTRGDNTIGVLDVSGGLITTSDRFADGTGVLAGRGVTTVTGGTVVFSTGANAFSLIANGANGSGSGFTGILNVGGGTSAAQVTGPSTTTSGRGLVYAFVNVNNSLAVANLLPNGTLTVNGITANYATPTNLFNFNGGTLKATPVNLGASFFSGANLSGAYVYGNGGTIDNSGTAITIGSPLLAPTGNGVSGISAITGGAGYIGAPFLAVTRGAGDTTGFGATAIAQIDDSTGSATSGQVTNVIITNPGNGYTVTPTFTLTGGGATTPATITGAAPTANVSGGLTFIGSGTTTLSGASRYTGVTTVNAGTLALSGSASLASSSAINLASGAKFDVSGLTSTFTLGASQTLSNSTSTAIVAGNFNAGSGTISLTYAGTTPALAVTNGAFTLSAGTGLNINNTGAALAPGSYVIITNLAGSKPGSVTGTVPANVAVNGGGTTSPGSLQIENGSLVLVVTAQSGTTLASSENPAGYLDLLTFTDTVQTNGVIAGNATGSVIFSANGTAFSTNSVSGGIATSAVLNTLPRSAGNLINATYSGDVNYSASTNTLAESVTNHPPVAANVTYSRDATVSGLTISISDLLSNVTDVDGDTVSLVSVGTSIDGISVLINGGSLSYNNPNPENDQFSYTVTDGYGGTNTGLVNIVLTNSLSTLGLTSSSQTNGYLTGVTFTAVVQTNDVAAGDATGNVIFLANDVAFSTNTVAGGIATSTSINNLPRGTGNIITANYSGDGNYAALSATLDQTVTNHPPVVNNVSYTLATNQTSLVIAISDLLTNVTDADGDTISLVSIGVSAQGVTLVDDAGTLTYNNPNPENDQFTYTVTDGYGGTNTGIVNILVSSPVVGQSGQYGKHNILLLIADDLGWDNLASFNSTNTGASIPYTPNLDALAQSGVVFSHFYARPSCSQSRACIFTGRDSFRTGVGCAIGGGNTPSLRTNEYTLPRAFATNAPQYGLASFGKWHLAGTSANLYDTDSPWLTGGWTNYEGFYGPQVTSYTSWTKWSNGVSFNSSTYTTLDQVHDATNFISSQGTNLWFVWLAFNAPHAPYNLPPTNLLISPQYINLSGRAQDIATNTRAYYEAMIQSLDTEIGVVLNSVNLTNTDIIFLGDNGTPIAVQQPPFVNASVPETLVGNGHAKFTIFEGGARTPLIIAGPDVASPGRTNDTLVNEPDLFSTIQELAGINVAATVPTNVTIDSVSLLPALQADVIRPTPYVIEEQFNEGTGANSGTTSDGVTLRNSEFKLIHFYYHTNDVSWERFYDLSSDPYEFTNLLNAPLTPVAQANYYALRRQLGLSATFENIQYRRNLPPAPAISSFQFTNGVFQINEQYTQLSPNVNTEAFPQLAGPAVYPAQVSLDYSVTLWRTYDLNDPLGWAPVANTILTPGTGTTLVISNTVISDLNATNDHAYYSVTPYIP